MNICLSKEQIDTLKSSIPYYTSHLETLRKLADVQMQGISLLKEINPSIDLSEFEEMNKLNGFNALLTISILDLITIVKQIFSTIQTWETLYFIRQGYLTIYESLKT